MEAYLLARYEKNADAGNDALRLYKSGLLSIPGERVNFSILKQERWLNKANLFTISLIFYLFGFILLGISWMVHPDLFRKVAYGSMASGFILHTY